MAKEVNVLELANRGPVMVGRVSGVQPDIIEYLGKKDEQKGKQLAFARVNVSVMVAGEMGERSVSIGLPVPGFRGGTEQKDELRAAVGGEAKRVYGLFGGKVVVVQLAAWNERDAEGEALTLVPLQA